MNIVEELKNLGLSAKQYVCVVTPDTFDLSRKDFYLTIVVSKEEFAQIAKRGQTTDPKLKIVTEIEHGGRTMDYHELKSGSITIDDVPMVTLEHAKFEDDSKKAG